MTVIDDEIKFSCSDCGWIGKQIELAFDKVESCMGDDETEICPKCGSFKVFFLKNDQQMISNRKLNT